MATVYLAIQENFEREVALKIMSPTLSEDSNFSERFLREARIVSRLVHPHIVTVHDVGIQNGHHYLSMEYIAGQDLKQRLPSLTGQQLFRVLREVASALDYAGKKGYVHRDVKPENIMLYAEEGRSVLMDFGIARAADSVSTMTRTGTALGTPHYMSPEQAKGDPIDGRSDLYSLGVLLYYMITGKVPYEADSAVAVGIKHITSPIPVLPDALAMYQPLINKLMAKKPGDRYQTGYELIEDLQRFDLETLNRWRPQQGVEYLTSHEYTPLRSAQVSSVNTGAGVNSSMSGSYLPPGPRVSSEYKTANTASQSPSNQEHLSTGSLLNQQQGLQTGEEITIPKEDLRERKQQPTTANSSNLVLVSITVVIGLVIGSAFYFNESLSNIVMYKKLEKLVGINTVDNQHTQDGVNAINLPPAVPVENNEEKVTTKQDVAKNNDEFFVPDNNTQIVDGGLDKTFETNPSAEVDTLLLDNQAEKMQSDNSNEILVLQASQQLEQLLQHSRELAAIVQDQPDKTDELIKLYRQIITVQPGQPEAVEALAKLRSTVLSVARIQIDIGETDVAQQSLMNAVAWFPELAEQESYLSLDNRIKLTTQINTLLLQAEDFLNRNRLIRPVNENAKETYTKVLSLDPNNEKAKIGLESIVDRYLKLALAAQKKRNFKKVQSLAASGLSVNPSYKPLLDLRERARVAGEREREISSLLVQAQIMESQQVFFGEHESAAVHYQTILAIDSQQIDAKQAMEHLLTTLYAQVETLVANKDYEQAIAKLETASITLPRNTNLQSKLQELNLRKPAVDSLMLSGQPITDSSSNLPDKVNADRTLHIAFHYKGLEQGATVLQALLFDGARSVQIAAVPVVVMGDSGSTQFRVDRPVEGFTDGGYHLDILLAGKRIFTNAFVIAR